MNELIEDRAMSCAVANLKLIKSLAPIDHDEARLLIVSAADCSHYCLLCVRGCETGSVLPETMENWCKACRHLQDLISASLLELPELTACAAACENCINACRRHST